MTIFRNLKNLIKKSGLHRKEQLTILFTVICFALSGFFLPSLKKDLSLEAEQVSAKSEIKDNAKKKSSKKADKNICKTPLVTEDTTQTEDNADDTTSDEAADASDPANPEDDAAQNKNSDEAADAATPSQDQNASNTPAASGSSSGSTSSSSQPSQSGSGSAATPSTPAAPEKVWVPPVYKTVHHDAVYQTVKVVICNYCGAEFNSTGEFQVHKDANGG